MAVSTSTLTCSGHLIKFGRVKHDVCAIEGRTGYPVIVNASFDVKDEPIVCIPENAHRFFMKTQMDVLILESYVIVKAAA